MNYKKQAYSGGTAHDAFINKYSGERSNLLLGVIGALAGTLLGGYFVYTSYFYMKSGLVAPMGLFAFAMLAYSFLGKGFDAKGLATCVLLTAVALWIANEAAWTNWFIEQVDKASGFKMDFWKTYPHVRQYLREVDYIKKYNLLTFRTVGMYLLTVIFVTIEQVLIWRRSR